MARKILAKYSFQFAHATFHGIIVANVCKRLQPSHLLIAVKARFNTLFKRFGFSLFACSSQHMALQWRICAAENALMEFIFCKARFTKHIATGKKTNAVQFHDRLRAHRAFAHLFFFFATQN
jgi:hypothetical protein